jgi:hypothetical protein
VQPEQSGFPCAMVYGLYLLSGETGLSCHRLRQDAFTSCTSCEETHATRASGLHDYTALRALVSHTLGAHRNTRDDRDAPLNRVRRARSYTELQFRKTEIFFAKILRRRATR